MGRQPISQQFVHRASGAGSGGGRFSVVQAASGIRHTATANKKYTGSVSRKEGGTAQELRGIEVNYPSSKLGVGVLFGQPSACQFMLRALRALRSWRPRMIRAAVLVSATMAGKTSCGVDESRRGTQQGDRLKGACWGQSLQRPKRIASRTSAPAAALAAGSSSVITEFPGKRYAPITMSVSRPFTICPIYC
jgi:hypothetical protein